MDTPAMPTTEPNPKGISMTERGSALHAIADEQIAELTALVSSVDEVALRLPCPGREKLADGTVGASVRHTADNYRRITDLVQASDWTSGAHQPSRHGGHRIPRFIRAFRHVPPDHADHGPGAGQHDNEYTADNIDPRAVIAQLSASRSDLGRIAALTDRQLDAIPPKDSFRFCDGQRTLEQVIASLLKHQRHQFDALNAAFASAPDAA
jgi:hypothetical protein